MRSGYLEWRDSLDARGQFLGGERLAEDDGFYVARGGAVLRPAATPARLVNYSGLFLVRAKDYDEALGIAAQSPHLQYGGILVRRAY